MRKISRLKHAFSPPICLMGAIASLAFMSTQTQAENMYVYKNKSGQVMLTNVNPSKNATKYDQKVKVTYYPKINKQSSQVSVTSRRLATPAHYRGFSTPSPSARRNAYDHLIVASATRHGVDPALLKAMMHTESAFNPNARSHAGAQGLMQLMPATARRFKVRNAWDPSQNIEGAAKYVAWLTKRFNGRVEYVVAGYNAGEGNVDKYGGIPPFKETRNYVKKVLGRYNSLYKNDARLLQVSNYRSTTQQPILKRTNFNKSRASYGTVRNQSGYRQIRRSNSYATSNNYAQSAFDALR